MTLGEPSVLICNAAVASGQCVDVLVRGHNIAAVEAPGLLDAYGSEVIDADHGALLPGLHDHHLHFLAYAAARASVPCGPPYVHSADELADALHNAPTTNGNAWLRGYGYYERVAGTLSRAWLDRNGPDRPIRIQHRSGRLWILNSQAIATLPDSARRLEDPDAPGSGRFYDADRALATAFGGTLPDVAGASRELAAFGITGFCDMTPANDQTAFDRFRQWQRDGLLTQRVLMAGDATLQKSPGMTQEPTTTVTTSIGATKFHLHEHALPPFVDFCRAIRRSHDGNRGVAVHCVTESELAFTLAALERTGTHAADRIEHASVTPDALLDDLQRLSLLVVTQSNFAFERGDDYHNDIDRSHWPWLYRLRSFERRGIPLALGSDAPFGSADPWLGIRTAVTRRTASGRPFNQAERIPADRALALYLGRLTEPASPRRIGPGAEADLCLLGVPWERMLEEPSAAHVRRVWCNGQSVFDRVDQSPG